MSPIPQPLTDLFMQLLISCRMQLRTSGSGSAVTSVRMSMRHEE